MAEIKTNQNPTEIKNVIRYFFLFTLLFYSNSAKTQCCNYILSMHDSYGDGWNGGSLEVFINGVSAGNYSATNFASSATFVVCQGDLFEMVYSAGAYEEENTYQLYDAAWNLLFTDGPNPTTGIVFSTTGDCNGIAVPGSHPCTAIPIDTGQCILSDNTGFAGSGINAGCASYNGGDVWFSLMVPPSGSVSVATDSGSIGDTGIAIWTDSSCTNLRSLGCDDDGNSNSNGYFSLIFLRDLNPGEMIYIQAWGYGGATGTFRICARDLGKINLDSTELPIVMINTLGQTIVENTKINALMDVKYNGPVAMTYLSDSANEYSGSIGIELRGASSLAYPQHSYGIETRTSSGSNNNVPILDMPADNDWALISNYNDRSLVRNVLAYRLFEQMGNYAPRTRLCEVLVDSLYKGIYLLCEKIKRDQNRVKIAKLTTADSTGDELTGGYILQQNYWDANNSFQSNYSPIDHPGFDVHFVYEYPKADSILPQQRSYIATYVDSLEDALYGANFADTSIGYRKYLDTKSFIDYFIVNELARNNDGFKKSVFFHKDKDSNGGKLKAGPVWDFDWAWKNLYGCSMFEVRDGSGWAHHVNDCPTDNYSCGWYVRMLQDSSFINELHCTYQEYRATILDTNYIFAIIDSVHNLVQNAQVRHFQQWPILGRSGPAPELDPAATTYDAELDTVKSWINLRLQWLDANIPGLCVPVTTGLGNAGMNNTIRCYPNPSTGIFYFEGENLSVAPILFIVYDISGKIVDQKLIDKGEIKFEYTAKHKGVYFFTLTSPTRRIQYGKMVVM